MPRRMSADYRPMILLVFMPLNMVVIETKQTNALEPPNVALGKPATQSSTEGDMEAARSVDGNVDSDPNAGSCSRTRHERRPWWSVNLEDYFDVHNVTITNVGGNNHGWINMRGFSVYVDASPGGVNGRKVCVDRAGAMSKGQTRTFTCTKPVSGRYVTIELYPEWPEKLNFCEVQVMGVPSEKVHGGWGEWSEYGDCSSTCGSGIKTRGRFCNAPAPENGGNSCPGIPVEHAECNLRECPVPGGWSAWSLYSACSASCGSGFRGRTRACDAPTPRHGGDTCTGEADELSTCKMQGCPVPGRWSAWSPFSACSASCGRGFRGRTRACDAPTPRHGGEYCNGKAEGFSTCNMSECPVDGSWGTWSDYGACSEACGRGSRTRMRSCDSPAPKHGGHWCPGVNAQTARCKGVFCPDVPESSPSPITETTVEDMGVLEDSTPETTFGATGIFEETTDVPESTQSPITETTVEDIGIIEETTPETNIGDTGIFEETTPETTVEDMGILEETTPETTVGDIGILEETTPETTVGDTTVLEETQTTEAPRVAVMGLPAGFPNPCTRENIGRGLFYHPYAPDRSRFIQCDPWGGVYFMPCRRGSVWKQLFLTCV